ncbi:MAG: DUF1015 domain-containing protein [Planctomycetota bacterium]|nr:DUF1015 domain-containing protein [Planctomycetota bacterium]
MAEVQPFRGWRYDIGQVGALAEVTAPPADVIDPAQQLELYQRHPCNIVRALLNRSEIGDESPRARHERAADFLRHWRSEGVLIQDHESAFYVYHQEFELDDRTVVRRGFLGRLRIEDFASGHVVPHEQTVSDSVADELALNRACRMNLSPILGLYADDADIQRPLEQAVLTETAFESMDDQGVTHRVWAVTQADVIEQARAGLRNQPIYIADGHHHYESARNYRDELRAANRLPDENSPANFVMIMLVELDDPSLTIAPTHRLVSGLPPLSSGDMKVLLGRHFEVDEIGTGPDAARETWGLMDADGGQDVLGFGTADGVWMMARLTDATVMESLASDQSESWRSLGVNVLHRLVLGHMFEQSHPDAQPSCRYAQTVDDLVKGMSEGGHQLASLVAPPEIEHVEDIAAHRELMPPKSTSFVPKLLSGLVFNLLD